VRHERHRGVRRVWREGRPAAEDHVVAVLARDRVAGVAALLDALVGLEAVVPAARALQHVAADRRDVAHLWRGGLAAGSRERGMALADALVRGHLGEGR